MLKERNLSVGYYSRPYNKDDTENKKPCKKVYFSQIKRVNKEDIKMQHIEQRYIGDGMSRHIWGKKKCTVIPKRVKNDIEPQQNGESQT